MGSGHEKLVHATALEDYFRTEVRSAFTNQKLEATPFTEFYLVRLLSDFSRSSALFSDQEPLAIQYLQSLHLNPAKGYRLLKQLADFALYISGFFQDSLNGKLVDVDYYIQMGGNAYHRLHDLSRTRSSSEAFGETFLELALNFIKYVDVLSEISEKSNLITASDLLRLYEKWLSTRSARLLKKLEELGIRPLRIPKPEWKH